MIIDRFVPLMEKLIDNRVQALSNGGCETLQQYTYACGEIFGLRKALAEFLELRRQATDDDDAGDPSA